MTGWPIEQAMSPVAWHQGLGHACLPERTQLEIAGADRQTWLHNLCTQEIRSLQSGEGTEALLTNVQGRILGHVAIFCQSTSLWLDTVPGQAASLLPHLDRYLIREDVQLLDRSTSHLAWYVGGAQAEQWLRDHTGIVLPPRIWAHQPGMLGDLRLVAARIPYFHPYGYLLILPIDGADTFRRSLTDADSTPLSPADLEIARLEAGWPWYGTDIDSRQLPQEISRDAQAIHFRKGCYLGQETVARIDALGHVNRHLVGLLFAGPIVPPTGTLLLANDVQVGHVTSAAYSPAWQATLALGYVRRGHHLDGTALQSQHGAARVVQCPWQN